MEISDKNIYENIINFADDRTVLNMLRARPEFNDPIFFKRVLDRKYPLLKEFKKDNETWRRFFIRMTYYIAKLNEEYGIPYIPTKGYDPEDFYKRFKNEKYIYNTAMAKAAKGGHMEIVQYLIDKKGANHFNWAMELAALGGHLDIIKYLIDEKGANEFNEALGWAALGGHLDIVKYLIDEKGADNFNSAMLEAARGHLDIVQYLIEKGADDFNRAITRASLGGHPEIVKYLKQFV